mmetsp:Transcript_23057/g.58513  ORF Transcript_23057/g.58513 Transcript_23057/m.58513 type:complete len:404 (-) Transcript_23057:853-2064(-)
MPLSPAPIDIEPPPLAPLELAQTEPPPPAASATPAPIETGQAEAERPTARLTHTNFTSEPLEMPLSPAPLKIAQAESTQPTADFTHAVTSTPLELEHKAETPIETPMVESGSSLTDVITRMSSAPLEQEAEAERPPAHSAHTNVTPTPLEVETPLPPEPLELAEMETPLVQGYQPLSPEPLELAEMETPPVQGVEEQILRSASALPPLPLDTVTPEQGGSGDRVLDGGETPQPPADSTQNTATPAPIEHEATKLVLRSASAQRRVLKAVACPAPAERAAAGKARDPARPQPAWRAQAEARRVEAEAKVRAPPAEVVRSSQPHSRMLPSDWEELATPVVAWVAAVTGVHPLLPAEPAALAQLATVPATDKPASVFLPAAESDEATVGIISFAPVQKRPLRSPPK